MQRAPPRARGRELRKAAAQLDIPWARSWLAGVVRENFLRFVLNPTMDYYTARRATGKEKLEGVKGPVILVANHASHMDTPVILSALPRRLRKRTVVAAAADYFYKNRFVASAVSLIFNTVPIERHGAGRDVEERQPPRQAARPGVERAALPRGHAFAGRHAGSAPARRGGAGGGAPPDDRADPGDGHRPGDAARPPVAEAPARQAGAQAPPDRGVVRRADQRVRATPTS